jgi:YfiH family protein
MLIRADWPAPASIHTLSTTRDGGVSAAPYDSLNLGDHVGDAPDDVMTNRARLRTFLPAEPCWLTQVHGTQVVDAGTAHAGMRADASITRLPGRVCAVLTADCLPVLFCNRAGDRVGAAHAGWRGLLGGVLEATLDALDCPPDSVLAWLGPAIGPQAFEVGDEVRQAFTADLPASAAAFTADRPGKWCADLYALARLRLARAGVNAVYGGGFCTVRESQRFFSYRRDGVTGRMASLIWCAA